jgi:hypothetical protein
MTALRALHLYGLPRETALAHLGRLPITQLELALSEGAAAVSLVGNSTLSEVTLEVPSVALVPSGLRGLPLLRSLRLLKPDARVLRRALEGVSVKELRLEDPRALRDLTALAGLTALERLAISDAVALRDLSALADLRALRVLELVRCPRVHNLEPLVGLPALERVRVAYARYTPLAVPPALKDRMASP